MAGPCQSATMTQGLRRKEVESRKQTSFPSILPSTNTLMFLKVSSTVGITAVCLQDFNIQFTIVVLGSWLSPLPVFILHHSMLCTDALTPGSSIQGSVDAQ